MKKEYIEPRILFSALSDEDVISTSGDTPWVDVDDNDNPGIDFGW